MDKRLSARLQLLKTGDKVKINGKTFTIREKSSCKARNALPWRKSDYRTVTTYWLGNDFLLEFDWEWKFFKVARKKWLLGTSAWSEYSAINEIEIVG